MEFTGNPFVDGGLAVVAHLAEKSDISELSLADIEGVLRDGSGLCRTNSGIKSFTMVFGTNGPLTQYAYRKSVRTKSSTKVFCDDWRKQCAMRGELVSRAN